MGKNHGSITSLWPRAATDADHGEREAAAEDTGSVRAIEAYWGTPLRERDLLIAAVRSYIAALLAQGRRVHVWLRRAQTDWRTDKNRGKTWANKALEAS